MIVIANVVDMHWLANFTAAQRIPPRNLFDFLSPRIGRGQIHVSCRFIGLVCLVFTCLYHCFLWTAMSRWYSHTVSLYYGNRIHICWQRLEPWVTIIPLHHLVQSLNFDMQRGQAHSGAPHTLDSPLLAKKSVVCDAHSMIPQKTHAAETIPELGDLCNMACLKISNDDFSSWIY